MRLDRRRSLFAFLLCAPLAMFALLASSQSLAAGSQASKRAAPARPADGRAAAGKVNASASSATAPFQTYVEMIPATEVKFEMVAIPGGKFRMGSSRGDKDEAPEREVIVKPFWMGATEVTWDEYEIFAFSRDLPEKAPAATKQKAEELFGDDAMTRPSLPYGDPTYGYGRSGNPVINITYHAAMEYCRWLSNKTGKTYRLATEAEWEYAARAGTETAYSFGDDPKLLNAHAWYFDNSEGQPHPVRRKKPNPFGLYDMHGNVAEWVIDRYDPNAYAELKSTQTAPLLLPDARRYPHVVRGGSWDDDPAELRSTARRGSNPEYSLRDPQTPKSIWWHTTATGVGFRIVRAVEEQENLRGLRSKITKESR